MGPELGVIQSGRTMDCARKIALLLPKKTQGRNRLAPPPQLGKQGNPMPTATTQGAVPQPHLLTPSQAHTFKCLFFPLIPEGSSFQKYVKCSAHHKISFSNQLHQLSTEPLCNEQREKRNGQRPLAPPRGSS